MILKGLFELVYNLLSIILIPFQIVPDVPGAVTTNLNRFYDFIFEPINILLYFTDNVVVMACIPLLIVIANMEHIWDGILWILKKLPFVGIE